MNIGGMNRTELVIKTPAHTGECWVSKWGLSLKNAIIQVVGTDNVGTPGLNMLANHVLREGGDMTVPQLAKLMQNWRPGPSSSAIGQIANMALSSEAQKLLAQGGAKTQMLSGTVCFLFVRLRKRGGSTCAETMEWCLVSIQRMKWGGG